MYKLIEITQEDTDALIGYFTVPKGYCLLEEAIACFVAEYWNKILFHRVLGVCCPIGLCFPDNIEGLNIDVVELKEQPFNISNLIDKSIRERLSQISPHITRKIRYDMGIRDNIFGILGTEKLSQIEEAILTDPEYDSNYTFEGLWKTNILLVELIKKTGIRPSWFNEYVQLLQSINSNTKFEGFRKSKSKNIMWLNN